MSAGVAATANSRSEAGPVVVSCVRRERMHAIRIRNGSRSRSARIVSAVGFQPGAVPRSRRMT